MLARYVPINTICNRLATGTEDLISVACAVLGFSMTGIDTDVEVAVNVEVAVMGVVIEAALEILMALLPGPGKGSGIRNGVSTIERQSSFWSLSSMPLSRGKEGRTEE
eukprot:6226005-Pyramimonas_sp.AAC.1